MEMIHNLVLGLHVAVSPANLLFCLVGAAVGTLVGVLPGLGPVAAIAMLLPLTFKMPAIGALIMLSGIYYGAHHAGATTAIMLNLPGEPTSIVICLDGHPMARNGRAGPALSISALASFFAGCVAVVLVATLSPVLASASLLFGPAEYAATIVMALVTASVLSSDKLMTTLSMAVLGLLLGVVGTDLTTGGNRFTFGFLELADGVNFVSVAVGLFAFSEIIMFLGFPSDRPQAAAKIQGLLPTRADLKASWKPTVRGTALGAFLGIFPGTGPLLSSFASYAMERRLAKDPSRFGNGAIEGVAGPEAANNAAALTHFIPMLTLGIPAGAAMALMLGALQIQGITPGPAVMTRHPDLFWGRHRQHVDRQYDVAGAQPAADRCLDPSTAYSIPHHVPGHSRLCCIGVFSVSNSAFDVALAGIFTIAGIAFKKLNCSPAPLVLALVLEPLLEENFRRAMILSTGDASVFFTRPISLGILILTLILAIYFSGRKRTLSKQFAMPASPAEKQD